MLSLGYARFLNENIEIVATHIREEKERGGGERRGDEYEEKIV